MYLFFRLATGLQTRAIPNFEHHLAAAGLEESSRKTRRFGLMASQLWIKRTGAAQPSISRIRPAKIQGLRDVALAWVGGKITVVASSPERPLPRPLRWWQSRSLTSVDLGEHEDKILLLLALVISAIVGLVVVAFLAITERMGALLLTAGGLQRFLSPLLGSLIAGWLLYRFFPEARGSGIPQTRVALMLQKGVISFRAVVGKFVCSSLSLSSGVALGREGPSVHIGAGIASSAGRLLGLSEEHIRSLIPVGTAAAVAAAFNTPLAAVLFTLEEILADLHARVVGTVVIGAATSWIILRLILGDEPLFQTPPYELVHPVEFVLYAILGVAGGLVSTVFVKLLLYIREIFQKTPRAWQPFAPGFGGLVVGLLALAVPGVLGVGYNIVSEALNGQLSLRIMLLLLVLKLIATTTSYSSGNAGGIFGPSLFLGAMLGGAVGQAAHTLFPDHTGNAGAYALVGMGAAFAGIIRTPMTSVIMIFELTRDYTIIVPLMIANLCSYVLAQRLQKIPIYEALSLQDGVRMPSPSHAPEPLPVEAAMRMGEAPPEPSTVFVHPDDSLDTALQIMGREGIETIPVIHRIGGSHAGTLSVQDAMAAYRQAAQEDGAAQTNRKVRNWLPAVAVATVAAVLIVSGLVVLQRSRRVRLEAEAYEAGRKLLNQGNVDAAVVALRGALAQSPKSIPLRSALGLALIRSGHFQEASNYLQAVVKGDPHNGPALAGLAQAAAAAEDHQQAIQLYQRALAGRWTAEDESYRRSSQLDLASQLGSAGRKSEASSLLLAIINQRGDDPPVARAAAELAVRFGTPMQADEAYAALANLFPGDAGIWMRLGDLRFQDARDTAALEAYQRAAAIDPSSASPAGAVARARAVLELDPSRRGLPIRERVRRWDLILARVVDALGQCESNQESLDPARKLLQSKAVNVELADRKMEAALGLWKKAPMCVRDPVITHVLGRFSE
jgi:CIC family chloride channel protein